MPLEKFSGDLNVQFGKTLPVPFIEKATVRNGVIDLQIALYFDLDYFAKENIDEFLLRLEEQKVSIGCMLAVDANGKRAYSNVIEGKYGPLTAMAFALKLKRNWNTTALSTFDETGLQNLTYNVGSNLIGAPDTQPSLQYFSFAEAGPSLSNFSNLGVIQEEMALTKVTSHYQQTLYDTQNRPIIKFTLHCENAIRTTVDDGIFNAAFDVGPDPDGSASRGLRWTDGVELYEAIQNNSEIDTTSMQGGWFKPDDYDWLRSPGMIQNAEALDDAEIKDLIDLSLDSSQTITKLGLLCFTFVGDLGDPSSEFEKLLAGEANIVPGITNANLPLYNSSVSDVSYVTIVDKYQWANQEEIAFFDLEDNIAETVMQTIDGSYYKVSEDYPEIAIKKTSDIVQAPTTNVKLKSVFDSIKAVLAEFGHHSDLIPELNNIRQSFGDKSSVTTQGRFYSAFKNVILAINDHVGTGVRVRKELIYNPRYINAKGSSFTDIPDPEDMYASPLLVFKEYDNGSWSNFAPGWKHVDSNSDNTNNPWPWQDNWGYIYPASSLVSSDLRLAEEEIAFGESFIISAGQNAAADDSFYTPEDLGCGEAAGDEAYSNEGEPCSAWSDPGVWYIYDHCNGGREDACVIWRELLTSHGLIGTDTVASLHSDEYGDKSFDRGMFFFDYEKALKKFSYLSRLLPVEKIEKFFDRELTNSRFLLRQASVYCNVLNFTDESSNSVSSDVDTITSFTTGDSVKDSDYTPNLEMHACYFRKGLLPEDNAGTVLGDFSSWSDRFNKTKPIMVLKRHEVGSDKWTKVHNDSTNDADGTDINYVALRSFAGLNPNGLDALTLAGTKSYRIMGFEFQKSKILPNTYAGWEVYRKYEASTFYEFRMNMYDYTHEIYRQLVEEMRLMLERLDDYESAALENCAWNEGKGYFNEFFVTGILEAAASQINPAIWTTAPFIYELMMDLLFDSHEGNMTRMTSEAEKTQAKISPQTGTPTYLSDFVLVFRTLYEDYYRPHKNAVEGSPGLKYREMAKQGDFFPAQIYEDSDGNEYTKQDPNNAGDNDKWISSDYSEGPDSSVMWFGVKNAWDRTSRYTTCKGISIDYYETLYRDVFLGEATTSEVPPDQPEPTDSEDELPECDPGECDPELCCDGPGVGEANPCCEEGQEEHEEEDYTADAEEDGVNE